MELNLYTERKCKGKISRYNWTIALLSMILHPTNPQKWRYFVFTEITDPKYKHYERFVAPIENVCLGEYHKEGLTKWVRGRLD